MFDIHGELESLNVITGDLEVVDFFPHLLEDSYGDIIIDSDENLMNDYSPWPQIFPMACDLVIEQTITGELIVN